MLPPADIDYLARAVRETAQAVTAAFQAQESAAGGKVRSSLLGEALIRLVDVLRRSANDRGALRPGLSPAELSEVGEQGMMLLTDLLARGHKLKAGPTRDTLETLPVSLALWIARQGGELRAIEPVVDALAGVANRSRDSAELLALRNVMLEIMRAVAPAVREDVDKANPGRPWRVLNLNQAIVATRTLDPHAMEESFETLCLNLPEEACPFFREGLRQMDVVGYPGQVREVLERYHRLWCHPTLH